MKHYETELPAGYEPAATLDAADKKTGVVLSVIANAACVLLVAGAVLLFAKGLIEEETSLLAALIFFVSMFVYLVLHELTHGVVYKLFTGRKLTFGVKFPVAYCGVPDIFVYRTAALCSVLAPFVVYTIVFGLLTILLPGAWNRFYSAILLAIHLSGCVGDLYDAWLFLFRFRDPKTLMRDNGPTQVFYVKK